GIFAALSYPMVAGSTVISALGQSASPRLAKHYAAQDRAAFGRLLLKLLGIGTLLGGAGILVALIAGRPLLTLLYQPEYASYTDVFAWLMLAAALLYLASFGGYGVTAARRFKVQPVIFGVCAASTALFCALLIPQYGIQGAAWATILSSALQLALMCFYTARVLYSQPRRRLLVVKRILHVVSGMNRAGSRARLAVQSLWKSARFERREKPGKQRLGQQILDKSPSGRPSFHVWKSSAVITAASVLGTAATAINSAILAYWLIPSDLGLLAILITVPTVVVIMSSLGFHFAGIYHFAQEKYTPVDVLSTVIWVGSAIGFLLTLLGIVGLPIIREILPDTPLIVVLLALAAILPQIMLLYFTDLSVGFGLLKLAVLMRVLPGGLYLATTVLLVGLFRLGVAGGLVAYLLGITSAPVIGLIVFYRGGYIRASINFSFLREGFVFGFKSHIGDIAQYLVYRLDMPLVGYFAGLSAAGYYSIATRIAEVIWLPSNSLRTILLARVSATKKQDS